MRRVGYDAAAEIAALQASGHPVRPGAPSSSYPAATGPVAPEIVASSLQFSIIRWRNARPRETG